MTITGLLLASTILFNSQQHTVSVFSKDPIAPGTYKVRAHANTPIIKAESEYGSCQVSGQDAVCNVTIPANAGGNIFVSTLTLQERPDNKYVVDFSASDPAVRPTPAILNTDSLNTVAEVKTEQQPQKTNVVTKRTGINPVVLFILLMGATLGVGVILRKRGV